MVIFCSRCRTFNCYNILRHCKNANDMLSPGCKCTIHHFDVVKVELRLLYTQINQYSRLYVRQIYAGIPARLGEPLRLHFSTVVHSLIFDEIWTISVRSRKSFRSCTALMVFD